MLLVKSLGVLGCVDFDGVEEGRLSAPTALMMLPLVKEQRQLLLISKTPEEDQEF